MELFQILKRDFEEQSSPLLEIHFYLRNWMQTASYQQFFVICSCLLFVISRDERFVKFLSEVFIKVFCHAPFRFMVSKAVSCVQEH